MVLLRREKYLLNILQNDVSREKLIKHLQSFVAGRATLEKLKTNAEGYFYLTEQDEAEINQLEENTRNFYQRPPAGQSYRPTVR